VRRAAGTGRWSSGVGRWPLAAGRIQEVGGAES
jgi:hypothetical protein